MNVNNKDFVMVESESEAAPYKPFWVLGGAWTLSQIVLFAGFPPEALSSLPTPQPWSPPSTRCCADQRTASTEPWTDLLQKNDVTVLSICYKLPPPPHHIFCQSCLCNSLKHLAVHFLSVHKQKGGWDWSRWNQLRQRCEGWGWRSGRRLPGWNQDLTIDFLVLFVIEAHLAVLRHV